MMMKMSHPTEKKKSPINKYKVMIDNNNNDKNPRARTQQFHSFNDYDKKATTRRRKSNKGKQG